MPRYDRTGPNGEGPMTGRGFGRCCVRGLRYGRGIYSTSLSKEEEKQILETQLKNLEIEKQEIEKRVKEIK